MSKVLAFPVAYLYIGLAFGLIWITFKLNWIVGAIFVPIDFLLIAMGIILFRGLWK